MAGGGGDGDGKFPSVDHVPLNEGAVIKRKHYMLEMGVWQSFVRLLILILKIKTWLVKTR